MKRFSRFLIIGAICLLSAVSVLVQYSIPGHAQTTTLKVQYMAEVTNSPTTKLQADFQVVNTGSGSVSLSQLTLRYWFTRDTSQSLEATCDYASLGCGTITEKATTMSSSTTKADSYLEVGFTSGTLTANASTGKIKIRTWKTDYSSFDQGNDYSFNASFASLTDWSNVTLYQNGTLIWGTEPTGATATPTPTNTPINTPTLTPTQTPTEPSFNQQQIDDAVAASLLVFPAPNSGTPRPGTGASRVYGAKALYFLALVTWYNPNTAASDGTSTASRLVAQIEKVVAGGNEPDANGNLEGWSHNAVAQALLLARNEPSVWNALTSTEQGKVDLLMKALAIAGNWGFNDANNFYTGLDELCNFQKTYNPNYREGYVGVMIAASRYFGVTQLNSIFTSFDYSSFTQQLQSAGFTNILNTWAKTGSTLLMQGGNDQCGGSGKGVRVPFTYNNVPLSDPVGIFAQLANFTYQDTVTSTGADNKAYIADHTDSPYNGQKGMEHEFNSTDSGGSRSDALYAYEGWMNSVTTRATLTALNVWGCGSNQTQIMQLMNVGSGDLLYKLQHGYEGYYLGKTRLVTETQPSSDGPSAKGFFFDKQVWQNVLAPVKTC